MLGYSLIAFTMLLLTIGFSLALDSTNLVSYYSFNDYANSSITDVHNGHNLEIGRLTGGNTAGTGLFAMDQSLKFVGYDNSRWYASQGFNSSNAFCVNVWFKTNSTDSNWLFTLGNNASLHITPYLKNGDIRLYNGSSYVASNATSFNVNNWNMYTYCNNGTGYTSYLNANFIKQQPQAYLTNQELFLSLGYAYTYGTMSNASTSGFVDELSVWSVFLTPTDISALYNLGNGISYTDITSSGGSETGVNYFYNICIGNVLCKILEINGTSNTCAYNNSVYCLSNCIDRQAYYENLGFNPANNSYDGNCGLCTNECATENSTQCNGDSGLKTCHLSSNGCYQWYYSTCPTNYICQVGICQAYANPPETTNNASNTPIGSLTQQDLDLWANFLNIDTTTSSNRLLVALLAIIIFMCIGLGLIFAISNAMGSQLPAFIVIGIISISLFIPIFYFIAINYIPFWIFLLTIFLIGLGTATFLTRNVFNKR